jgi:arginase
MKKIALIGYPYDENSSFLKGPAKAPPIIREALFSQSSNLWSELEIEINETVLTDFKDVEINSNSEAFKKVEKSLNKIFTEQLIPVCLGGDHFLTYPIIKVLYKKYPNLQIFHFDAHPDLYDELDGNRLSHACPFARIMEEKLANKLTQIGIRGANDHQLQQAKRFGVNMIELKNMKKKPNLSSDLPIYISFDLDAIDPAFAPGVSHHEPGGLSTRDAIDLIHSIEGNIVGADIVELNPDRDPSGISAMAAAKILKEIAAKIVLS